MARQPTLLSRLTFIFTLLIILFVLAPRATLAATAAPGDIIVNEIMQNPNAVFDSAGEWFEVHNTTGADIDIDGWTIRDDDIDSHVINNGGPLMVPAGGFLVLGNNTDSGTNGGAPVAYSYGSSWFLSNAADEVVLEDTTGTEIDRVNYDDGATFPDPTGAAMALFDPALDNNVGANWCTASTPYGAGDLGTPGAANDCGEPPAAALLINEIDADTPSTDMMEFIELYDEGFGNTVLDGLVVVFYNGSDDTSYAAFDLDGFSTDANGYFVLGNAAVSPDLVFTDNTLQNGADAVALYEGNAADFPNGTALTTTGLLDAVVYDTDDPDDPELLTLLNAGQPQVNENGGGDKDNQSSGRCPNGSGGALNTNTYEQNAPSPGAANVCGTTVTIMQIQGAGHKSPLDGQSVNGVAGIVTAVGSSTFIMQDPIGDGDIATSDGIIVFTGGAPTVAVGDSVLVDGTVSEFYPGGFDTGNLATTEIVNPTVSVLSSGNPLPAPVVIGIGGRVPPNVVIDDDATGDVETTGSFDPATDGIDFYESLEAMLVQVNDAHVVGSNRFGEIAVVADNGANAGVFTVHGGLVIQPGDFNPERIIIDDGFVADEPDVTVGDDFAAPIIGFFDYSFGNFKLINPDPLPALIPGGVVPDTTTLVGAGDDLTVATLNVENLDPNPNDGDDDSAKFVGLADEIVNNLMAPDIIAVQEIQDGSGATDDGTVAGDATYAELIAAIATAGGPVYDFREIAPQDLTDGGQPGGNIRVGFLFQPARVTFVDRPGGDATTSTAAVPGSSGVELTLSPGRIDPTNIAFFDSRKVLAGEFSFNGQTIILINAHFNSKGGDDPLFGRVQPPVFPSEVQRLQQAQVVNDFVDSILAVDPAANVVVLGDLNDFQFSAPVQTVAGGVLTNLIDTLALPDQYTFIFDGNSQVLDHMLISDNLLNNAAPAFDAVHANADFDTDFRPTDHDPLVGRFTLIDGGPPTGSPPVCDNAAPSIASIWPPNGMFRTITIQGITDPDGDPVMIAITSIFQDEPVDSVGDGGRAPDGRGVGTMTAAVRAERIGSGNGRVYHISFSASDGIDGACTGTVKVGVPRKQSVPAIDDGPLFDSTVMPPVMAGVDLVYPPDTVINFEGKLADESAIVSSISWDMGDGVVYEGTLTPAHSYSEVGFYDVSLSVVDGEGKLISDTLVVQISIPTDVTLAQVESGTTVGLTRVWLAALFLIGAVSLIAWRRTRLLRSGG